MSYLDLIYGQRPPQFYAPLKIFSFMDPLLRTGNASAPKFWVDPSLENKRKDYQPTKHWYRKTAHFKKTQPLNPTQAAAVPNVATGTKGPASQVGSNLKALLHSFFSEPAPKKPHYTPGWWAIHRSPEELNLD
ncbi:MAG: hypothetical protein AB7S81_04190 [Bdellovibrionales bacterium]